MTHKATNSHCNYKPSTQVRHVYDVVCITRPCHRWFSCKGKLDDG